MRILYLQQNICGDINHISYLREMGCTITTVQTTEHAIIEITSEKKFDIIVSEVSLPFEDDALLEHDTMFENVTKGPYQQSKVSGLIIWDKYSKKHLPTTSTLFFTKCPMDQDMIKELQINYLPKPCEPKILLEQIKMILSQNSA